MSLAPLVPLIRSYPTRAPQHEAVSRHYGWMGAVSLARNLRDKAMPQSGRIRVAPRDQAVPAYPVERSPRRTRIIKADERVRQFQEKTVIDIVEVISTHNPATVVYPILDRDRRPWEVDRESQRAISYDSTF